LKEDQKHIHLNRTSFEKLFRDHFIELTYFARKIVEDMDGAKDIVHQVYINLWDRKEEINMGTPLKSYLYASVRNRCMNFIRDQKKFSTNEMPEIEDKIDSSHLLEHQETEARIQQAINELPEKCREIFLLNRFDGLKYSEVANELSLSVKTVEAQMSKALKLLREKLSDLMLLILTWLMFK
jgi:RNA polymerase sigma-70 factor (ECF subfamily)